MTSGAAGDTAVLFIVFNRPELTRRSLDAIRAAAPTRLYIACDGPRGGRADDRERVAEVHRVIDEIDWDCRVHRRLRSSNLGCRAAVIDAIDWFFEREAEGVIVEDDCLPHRDFFTFANWALTCYRDEPDVWHVNGNTFGRSDPSGRAPAFGALAQAWGWATWADRWHGFDGTPAAALRSALRGCPRWRLPWGARVLKLQHLARLLDGLDTWDYQWQARVLNHRGLCVCPPVNLVTNVGDGPDATHTRSDSRVHIAAEGLAGSLERVTPRHDPALTAWYCRHMGLDSRRSALAALPRLAQRAISRREGAIGRN